MKIVSQLVTMVLLAVSTASPCAEADALRDGGYVDAAEAAYGRLAGQEACAREGLGSTSVLRCHAADALRNAGLEAEAMTAYESLLKVRPGLRCALDGFESLTGPKWIRTLQSFNGRVLTPVLALVGALGLLALIAVGMYRRFLGIRLDVGEVAPSGKQPGDEERAHALVHDMQDEIVRLSVPRQFPGLRLIDGPVDPPKLPDLAVVPKEVGQLWDFVARLFPARTLTLSAAILPDPADGRGGGVAARLTCAPGNALWGSVVLREGDLDASFASRGATEAGAYSRLARAAARWAVFAIHTRTAHAGDGCSSAACHVLRDAFGTDDWKSYSAVREAVRLSGRDRPAAHRELVAALDKDPENRYAIYNQARLELLSTFERLPTDARAYERLRQAFQCVIALSSAAANVDDSARAHPAVVFAHYNLGVIAWYRQVDMPNCEDRRRLLERAVNELSSAMRAASTSELRPSARRDLEIVHACCQRSLGVASGDLSLCGEARDAIAAVEASGILSAWNLYNLACFYACSGATGDELESAAVLLDRASKDHPAVQEWSRRDPSLRALLAWRERVRASG